MARTIAFRRTSWHPSVREALVYVDMTRREQALFVCSCFAVSERTLRSVISAGVADEDEVGDRCSAGTGCGGCREWICEMIADARTERDGLSLRSA
ncbi:MAG: (2Fe-2S)-binding protein [Frankia sp.]